ncbi:MAG: ISAs1 family transposase [Comamonadaceae bacterium]|nr:ISAs1 family transposase [Comamonadaceae bacterium]
MLAGADNFVEIEMWACDNFEWFRRYLNLENSIASHDTFGRLFGVIEAQAFASALCRWVSGTLPALAAQELAAIDGKTSRRPGKLDASRPRVSAFAAGAKLLPGQTAAAPTS